MLGWVEHYDISAYSQSHCGLTFSDYCLLLLPQVGDGLYGRTINAFINSHNGRVRAECLNENGALSLNDPKAKVEAWRQDYNNHRPHGSLRNLTPKNSHSPGRQFRTDNAPQFSHQRWSRKWKQVIAGWTLVTHGSVSRMSVSELGGLVGESCARCNSYLSVVCRTQLRPDCYRRSNTEQISP